MDRPYFIGPFRLPPGVQKYSSRVYEVSTLALEESDIIIKVYNNLKRLLIITFNIKSIREQSSQSSHPVKFALCWIRTLRFISKPNLYIFKKASLITLLKETLEKLLSDIFCAIILNFSNITLMVIPSTLKMVGGITYILFTACLTA